MERKLLKRKSWSNDGGVSEIVGNIMILMITVVLFSGIMMFVNQIPMPEMTVKADFTAGVTFDSLGTSAVLTVTHIGGATMDSVDTIILVTVDGNPRPSYRLSEEPGFPHDEWAAGLSWVSESFPADLTSSISVTIIDEVNHNAVWVSQVSGGMGNYPPNILQRFVDSNEDTPTADPVKQYDDFTLYVKVSDIDLRDVWIETTLLDDLSDGANDGRIHSDNYGTSEPEDGGWFEWAFEDVTDNIVAVDGHVITIGATDNATLSTVIPYKLSVIVLPTDTTIIYTDDEPTESGMPYYITKISDGQGYEFFGANVTVNGTSINLADPRTNFTRGEQVYIRAASKYVDNLLGGNELTFEYSATNVDLTASVVYVDPSSAETPFRSIAYGGNVAVYQCIFNTTDMMPGTYNVHALLSSAGTTVNYDFVFDEVIFIEDPDSYMDYYPKVWVSNDESFTSCWGYSKTVAFNASGVDSQVWVAIAVQDAQDTDILPNPSVGEIRVMDMTGGTELYGPPNSGDASGLMISEVDDSDYNSTAYVFYIDLRLANGDDWKLGTNTYSLQISQFSDENEGIYAYSLPFFVRASSSRADFFVTTNGVYNSLGSSTNFISPDYVYYVENNNFFTMRTLYYQENAPSTAPMYYQNAMAVGDLDNDGDMDLLVGSNMDNSGSYPNTGRLLYFENTMSSYGVWQSASYITRPSGDTTTYKIKWIDTGDINGDGFTDFAYTTTEGKVWLFNNTYGAVGVRFPVTVNESTNDGVRKLMLEDMNADGYDDLILLKEGKMRVYDLRQWTQGCIAKYPDDETTVCNIEDFDIADVNGDGMLDILTTDYISTSNAYIQGVWVNNYTDEDAPDPKVVDLGVTGLPYVGNVVAGDLASTQSMDDADASIALGENETGDGAGSVSFVFAIQPLTDDLDQQLVVRAKVTDDDLAGDEALEVFYVWYSTDQDLDTAKFTPVMSISGGTFEEYTFNLPASAAGAEYLWVKITDSSMQLGTVTEAISIDHIGVYYDRFGTYWPAGDSPSRYLVAPTTDDYVTVRAMDLDGEGGLEVAVAKDFKFSVYEGKTQVAAWTITDTTSSMLVSTADDIKTVGRAVLEAISPTLFQVVDVNGDGLDDILTTWITIGDSYEVSLVKLYLNMGEDLPWAVSVKDVFAGMLDTSEKGSIVCLAAADVYNRA